MHHVHFQLAVSHLDYRDLVSCSSSDGSMDDKPPDLRCNGGKSKFKEKIVTLYEQIFLDDQKSTEQPHFWNDFFLLKPNLTCFRAKLELFLNENNEPKIINRLVSESAKAICDHDQIRCANGLQTLSQIVACCSKSQLCTESTPVISMLFGNSKCAEDLINRIISRCCSIFADPSAKNALTTLCLRLLLAFVTIYEDLNRNTLLDYFSNGNDLFNTLLQILGSPIRRKDHGKEVLVLLTLLVNYRKYENVNPFIVMLSILDNDLALNGYSHSICTHFCSVVSKFYQNQVDSSSSSGILTSLSSMVGSIWRSADDKMSNPMEIDIAMLLAFYEAVHLNRNFITTLTTVPSEQTIDSANADSNESSNANLLVAFLTFTSIIFSDLRTENSRKAAKLCSIILTCITEDQYANALMHDNNLMFKVQIYRVPTRYRQRKLIDDRFLTSKRLICTILDVCVEFMLSHMMKNLPGDLYLQIFGIIQRILCYEKKMRLRLEYDWRNLWDVLATFLKYVVNTESSLINRCNIFLLIQKVISLFNLFITYGDTFLPNPATYDLLYYELIRNGETFNNSHSMLLRYTAMDNVHKDIALKLCNNLINIRGIVNHFHTKIVESLDTTAVTENDILKIVKSNYDTLILKLQENLDFYEPYNEKPQETAYFSELVKHIIMDEKSKRYDLEVDYQCFLDS